MFVSKGYLEDLLARNLEQQDQIRRGYLARIENLESEIRYLDRLNQQYQSQIEDLRSLVFPKMAAQVSSEAQELDAVISGSEKPIDMSEEQRTQILEGAREQDLILSGNYDLDLMN